MPNFQKLHIAEWSDILNKSEISAKLEVAVNGGIENYPLFFEMDGYPSLKGPLGGNVKYTRLFLSETLLNNYIDQKKYAAAFISDSKEESSYLNLLLKVITENSLGKESEISIIPYLDFDESLNYMRLEFILLDYIRELSLLSLFYYSHYENNEAFNNSKWSKVAKAILRHNHFLPEEFEKMFEDSEISESISNLDYLNYFLEFPLSDFGVFIELSSKYKNCASKFCRNAPNDSNIIFVMFESFVKQQIQSILSKSDQ